LTAWKENGVVDEVEEEELEVEPGRRLSGESSLWVRCFLKGDRAGNDRSRAGDTGREPHRKPVGVSVK
jgi:hypothetical protein